ncbi:MAG: sugar transferase [Oscillospiraceae bacterium]|nr:sugar transferase [Oscillospiraceae bacterium]
MQEPSVEGDVKETASVVFTKKPVYDFVKRVFDIVCSLFALIVLSPVLLIVAVIIMIDDFGNPFFVQKRTGKDSKVFKMYKFRSMRLNAESERNSLLSQNEADGPIFKITEDPRITKFGKFIRKTSIDELPQLLNVLKGEMSIIGPRPLPTYEQEACNEYQQQRLLVKPGLSCYTALDKDAHDDFDRWIELDMKYIRERSFATDIKIIFKTVGVVLGSKNQ